MEKKAKGTKKPAEKAKEKHKSRHDMWWYPLHCEL